MDADASFFYDDQCICKTLSRERGKRIHDLLDALSLWHLIWQPHHYNAKVGWFVFSDVSKIKIACDDSLLMCLRVSKDRYIKATL